MSFVCLFVCLLVGWFVCLFVCLFVCWFVCWFVGRSMSLDVVCHGGANAFSFQDHGEGW